MPLPFKIVLFLVVLLLSFKSHAQPEEEEKIQKKLSEYVKDAEAALLRFDDKKAEQLYLKVLVKKPDYAPAMRGLAVVYDLQLKYEASAKLLEKIVQQKPYFSRVIYCDIAIAHYRYGNYEAGINYFNKFDSIIGLPVDDFGFNGNREMAVEFQYRSKISENIRACKIAKDSIFNKNVLNVLNIGLPINTTKSEYFPFLSNDQNTIYFTRQRGFYNSDENLFYSKKDTNQWAPSVYIDSVFNTSVNEGMATFTRDGRQMFFTACQRPNVDGTCDIQRANMQDVNILKTKILEGKVNSERWESQACISCDGTALYFTSNRDGGQGKTDLYVSYLQEDNTWGPGENLGSKVNTDKDEEAPFITNDGKTLFFSSTGHLGLGEQDLFMSQLDKNGVWGEAINLGPPINTAYRELGFFLSADGLTGFYSSDRPGGQGKMDIYQFNLSKELSSEPITYMEGYVKDSITLEPVQTILYPKNHSPVPTDEEGRFFLCLKADEDFNFKINEQPYLPYHRNIDIPVWDNKTFFPVEILLQTTSKPKPPTPSIETKNLNVYFEFDQYNIADSTQQQLKNYQQHLASKTIQKIEIIGYCDYIGSNGYNRILSENRANAVAAYLKNLSIIPTNESNLSITIQGKGEINNQAPRALNRRVEIRIFMTSDQ